MINEYDKIRLKSGKIARVCEILGNGAVYIIEAFGDDNHVHIEQVTRDEIASVFIETEQQLVTA